MRATRLFKKFFESEKSSGLTLIACTILSLIVTNSGFGTSYLSFFQTHIFDNSLVHWINDGLMTIFFLLIGLELEREIYQGELSNIKDALLPTFAALGGMLFPAGIFLLLNFGSPTQSGAGIPMATDIAFALGILSLLGKSVPTSLKIFLTALAVIDDLGAILVIAIFYTDALAWTNLLYVFLIFIVLFICNRLKVRNLFPYLIGGIFMWYFMLNSGIHATITGILLAFVIPFGNGGKKSTSYILQHYLHKPVAFFILPLFALANTAIGLSAESIQTLSQNYSYGIGFGLLIGKPIGVFALSYLVVKLKICELPKDLNWGLIFGVGILAGIGFTMSIFITLLAYENIEIIENSKLAILLYSFIASLIGLMVLKINIKKTQK